MKINVQDIPDEGIEVEDEESFQEEGLRSRALLTVRVERSGADVFIRGEARAGLVLTCSRCLEDFTGEIGFPVDLSYCPEGGAGGGQESHELSPDELETGFYSGEEIDLREITKEQVLLNMPMKPLCAETCKGICPVCGANLNAVACGCDLKGEDQRFGALKDFFKKRKE